MASIIILTISESELLYIAKKWLFAHKKVNLLTLNYTEGREDYLGKFFNGVSSNINSLVIFKCTLGVKEDIEYTNILNQKKVRASVILTNAEKGYAEIEARFRMYGFPEIEDEEFINLHLYSTKLGSRYIAERWGNMNIIDPVLDFRAGGYSEVPKTPLSSVPEKSYSPTALAAPGDKPVKDYGKRNTKGFPKFSERNGFVSTTDKYSKHK